MSIKLIDISNKGPELLKYEEVIAAINSALDDVVDGRRDAVDALQLIDYNLYARNLSTYKDCSFARPDGHCTIRNFSRRTCCTSCNFRIPYDYITRNGLEKSRFYADNGWYRIVKEEDDI